MEHTTVSRVSSRTARTLERRSGHAIHSIAEEIHAKDADLNILFVSPEHDIAAIEREWRGLDAGPTIACTTAGEIHHEGGYLQGSIAAASLRGVGAIVRPLPDLAHFGVAEAEALEQDLLDFIEGSRPNEMVFGIVLMDGLSKREELVVAALANAMPSIPLVGGSAGDELAFRSTQVFADGAFRSNAGALALVRTASPAHVFMTHHFEPTGERLVVTAADPAQRRVFEFNGRPASAAYREATGLGGGELTKEAVALHPLMLGLCDRTFVRSIAAETDGGALDLYCAIEEGLVLQIGKPAGMIDGLTSMMTELDRRVPDIELVLTFDCILRRLELQHCDLSKRAATAMARHRVVGFSTYGEVFGALHVNQTLTGIAFGR